MRSKGFKEAYSLLVKANYGFSNPMSQIRGMGGRTQYLDKKRPAIEGVNANFNDSIIAVNTSFIEVVDSGNRLRGLNSFFGLIVAIPALFAAWWLIYGFINYSDRLPLLVASFGWLALIAIFFMGLPMANALIRWDMFRKTHYPMRFNRRDRKVYAWSQDMGVVTMNWDDIQFYMSQSTASQDRRGMARDEIRGFVQDRNGNMLHHLIFFKYQGKKNMLGALEIWELVRRYMEEPDGHIQAYRVDQRVLDMEGKRESFINSLIQATRFMADSPMSAAVLAPMVMWVGTGRLLAKWTCRVPRWPAWVEEKCRVAPDDPYVRHRRNEPPLTAKEILWPLFCFLLGWVEVLTILYFCFGGYF